MAFTKVLIAVKTYPTLSRKYTELVCTAGFRDDGSWIRIYPSPFRFLATDQRYRKYQWVELDLERNPSDPRPESHRPRNIDDIRVGSFVASGKDWGERRRLILERNTIHTSLAEIIKGAKDNSISLAVFKPTEILDLIVEDAPADWELNKKQVAEASLAQGSLFDDTKAPEFKLMPKLPVKFSYKFKDADGKTSTLMIEDWEIGQLYWSCLKGANKKTACAKVRQKYFDEFVGNRDVYLFLGTTREWHARAPNPYLIVGVFYPPPQTQPSLL